MVKGIFWNSAGLHDPAKHRFIHDLVREQHMDFVAILETGRSNFLTPFLNHLAGALDFAWYTTPARQIWWYTRWG